MRPNCLGRTGLRKPVARHAPNFLGLMRGIRVRARPIPFRDARGEEFDWAVAKRLPYALKGSISSAGCQVAPERLPTETADPEVSSYGNSARSVDSGSRTTREAGLRSTTESLAAASLSPVTTDFTRDRPGRV